MFSINHMGQSQAANAAVRLSTRAAEAASVKLTTGMRIQSAADDAAGLALASHFSSEARAMIKVSDSVHSGLSITQVADTGLSDIRRSLQRMRELAVQAATGTLNDPQRTMLNTEFTQLKSEIDDVTVRSTESPRIP